MKIRLVNKNEFDELMGLMNISFNFVKEEDKFENILPKLYFKDNKNMIHYGVFEDDKLVASIGLYFMKLSNRYHSLKVGCVGAVSTHPDYRLKGYFKLLMKKIVSYAKRHNFDLLFLGGNRVRYNYFGFENAGRRLIFNVSKRTKNRLKSSDYTVEKLQEDNVNDIKDCLSLYNKQEQHIDRSLENFYSHIISWNCIPYVVKVDGKVVGYFTKKDEDNIYELVYKKGYLDTILLACLADKNGVNIQLPYSEYNRSLLNKIDWYRVEHNEMHLVLNWDNVAKYMNFKEGYQDSFNKLTKKEKIRYGLGCDEFPSKYSNFDLFIYSCDQG